MNGGFDWRSLGKADYAQANALVGSLPEDIRCQMNGTERETLCRITHLIWISAQTGGRGRGYCIPSERWLASKVQRSERTVRRCLTVLRGLGLLSWVRRKGKGNEWLSNLYTLGKSFLASLFARKGKKVKQIHQRTFLSDNDLKREYKASAPVQTGERLTDFLAKLREKAGKPLEEANPLLASDSWD